MVVGNNHHNSHTIPTTVVIPRMNYVFGGGVCVYIAFIYVCRMIVDGSQNHSCYALFHSLSIVPSTNRYEYCILLASTDWPCGVVFTKM